MQLWEEQVLEAAGAREAPVLPSGATWVGSLHRALHVGPLVGRGHWVLLPRQARALLPRGLLSLCPLQMSRCPHHWAVAPRGSFITISACLVGSVLVFGGRI